MAFSPLSNPFSGFPLVGPIIDAIQSYLTTGIAADYIPTGGASAGAAGLLSALPAASTRSNQFYYATDQDVLYFSDGSNWLRQGLPTGSTTMVFNASVPTGWVAYDGGTLPASTGIYAALYAHLGGTTTKPDTRGRMLIAKGTHADVSTVGNSDGQAVADRRPKHRTTNGLSHNITASQAGHSHDTNIQHNNGTGSAAVTTDGAFGLTHISTDTQTPAVSIAGGLTGSIGTNVANDNLDAGSYIVFNHIAKL